MHLDWWTLALQTVNFLVLIWLLWRFLYRPVRQVIEKRKGLADAAFRDAEARAQAADTERVRLEQARAALAEERQATLKSIHEELERERAAIHRQAESQADTIAADGRAALAAERSAALEATRDEVLALAKDMAATLLRQTDDHALYDGTLDRIERYLAALPAAERTQLRDDLSLNGGQVQVVTAIPLTPSARQNWRERLAPHLGDGAQTTFRTDTALVGGAELHFPHAHVKFSWADQLDRAKDLLRGHDDDS